MQLYGRERQNVSFPVDKGIFEEVKAVRRRLRWIVTQGHGDVWAGAAASGANV